MRKVFKLCHYFAIMAEYRLNPRKFLVMGRAVKLTMDLPGGMGYLFERCGSYTNSPKKTFKEIMRIAKRGLKEGIITEEEFYVMKHRMPGYKRRRYPYKTLHQLAEEFGFGEAKRDEIMSTVELTAAYKLMFEYLSDCYHFENDKLVVENKK
ncbi:MAG: hypothetical protein V3U72_00710 [Candidatus Aenigmarchaeota archaeon]